MYLVWAMVPFFGPFVLQKFQENPARGGSVWVCAKRFPHLCPWIFIRYCSVWYMKYGASDDASFGISDFWYLQNSASCFEFIVIFGRKTRFLGYRLLRFKDIENRRRPKDAPRWAAYFTCQTLNSLINICGLKVMVRLKNRRFLMG